MPRRPSKKFHIPVEITFGNALVIRHQPAPQPIRCVVSSTIDGFTISGAGDMTYTLPDDKMVDVKITYVDSHGHPASVDGAVAWTSSDDQIVTVVATDGDNTQARITPGANLGQAQITATVDADLGEGVRELITTLDVTVVGGEAVTGTIEPVGEPQPIP